MKITVIGSNSKGNCLILESDAGVLLLDAGVPFKKIQEALKFDLTNVKAALITHEHKDHSKAVPDLIARGIKCVMSKGTYLGIDDVSGRNAMIVDKFDTFDIGKFTILPFDAEHDALEPFGYLIQDNISGEKVVFLTDSFYCKYTFKDVQYYIVECNYIAEILESNVEDGIVTKSQADRLWNSHFSLYHLKKFFAGKNNIQGVVLIHLSDLNSDEERMVYEIQSVVGCPVYAAQKGQILELGIQF